MDATFKALYERFYTLPKVCKIKPAVEEDHRQLIDRLEKPERKLVLRIIDTKDMITEELSLDSFICVFRLAWQIVNQIQSYGWYSSDPEVDEARHSLCREENDNAQDA